MENYESKYWGLIYDQMMLQDLAAWVEETRNFYSLQLNGVAGPVLECACGTGLILLHLLERGIDIRGFDASNAMLASLLGKAPTAKKRVSRMTMESFEFDQKFDAIIIPTNSFSMLTTADLQRATLINVRKHLAPGGRLLMDVRLAIEEDLESTAEGFEGRWHEWRHPETGGVIRQKIVADPHDFPNRLFRDRCFFEYEDDSEEFPMTGRWIFADELESLLTAAGFTHTHVEAGEWGSYWVAH